MSPKAVTSLGACDKYFVIKTRFESITVFVEKLIKQSIDLRQQLEPPTNCIILLTIFNWAADKISCNLFAVLKMSVKACN